jgi:hypothetical protein
MRVVCLQRHWESLREIFRDLNDLLVAPYRIRVVWA